MTYDPLWPGDPQCRQRTVIHPWETSEREGRVRDGKGEKAEERKKEREPVRKKEKNREKRETGEREENEKEGEKKR